MFKVLFDESYAPIELLHPMTEEHSILRRSLVPSLLDIVKYNNARKNYNLSIYEISLQYGLTENEPNEHYVLSCAMQGVHSSNEWQGKKEVVDFYYVKGILDTVFTKVGAQVKYRPLSKECAELHPGRSAEIVLNDKVIGFVGEVHPTFVKQNDIEPTYVFEVLLEPLFEVESKVILFKQISKVPSVERDLALVMDLSTPVGEVVDAIYRCDKAMIKKVSVFDVYVGDKIEEGKKSVAVRITLEAQDTLTDEVINQKMKKILNTLAYCFKIEIRK
jgi:phenylalanyl-tRNA synthetase beta chain